MKKIYFLSILSVFFLISCSNGESFSKKKYVTGAAAETIKNDLMNQLNNSYEKNAWSGLIEEDELKMTLKEKISAEGSKINLDLDISSKGTTKATFNSAELNKANPNYSKLAKLSSSNEMKINGAITNAGGAIKIEGTSSVNLNYGFANIKPDAHFSSIESDFLFMTMTTNMTVAGVKSETKEGYLNYGLADALFQTMPSYPTYDEEGLTELEEMLVLLEDYFGFSKEKNTYYICFDIGKFLKDNENVIENDMTVSGKLYLKLAFKNDSLTELVCSIENLTLSEKMRDQEMSMTINANTTIKPYAKDVSAPTQKDVTNFGYENINKSSGSIFDSVVGFNY